MVITRGERAELHRLRDEGPQYYYGKGRLMQRRLATKGLALLTGTYTELTELGRIAADLPDLSPQQWQMLDSIARHGDALAHVRGQSAHGGAVGTRASLQRAGLIDETSNLTEEGQAALQKKLQLEGML